jgi:UDP-2-acetamido-3-amino-2,3-dideoxy-glucuronate N-acetyltransferase
MSERYFHPKALVESDQIGAGTRVWAFAHVMPGAQIGTNCNVGDHAFVESGAVVGNNVTLKNNVCVWLGVKLEDDVFVGERGVAIGANATILPGVRLGRYSMIAAGSVVTEDVSPFALVVGSPARQIGDMCRCGQRLPGEFRTATCTHCQETPELRCVPADLEAIQL